MPCVRDTPEDARGAQGICLVPLPKASCRRFYEKKLWGRYAEGENWMRERTFSNALSHGWQSTLPRQAGWYPSQRYIVMVLYSYDPIQLWPYIVMAGTEPAGAMAGAGAKRNCAVVLATLSKPRPPWLPRSFSSAAYPPRCQAAP